MLDISPLKLGYGEKPVLSFPGMKLEKGTQCLITGSSGSGKTTLLYAIAGLIPVMEGKIVVSGTEITALPESGRDLFRGRNIGIIFQTLHLVKSLTVLQNLLLTPYIAGLEQSQLAAEQALEKLGIADKRDALPEKLSQGQAQRVAIARSVMHRPSLILADEPTSSLDDASCEDVIRLIRQTAQEIGAALLISTHDRRLHAHFGDVIHLGDRS